MIFEDSTDKRKEYRNKWFRIYRYYAINYMFFEMDTQIHEEWELMYVVHGKCLVRCLEGENERNYHLKGGEYILLAGSVPHELHVPRDGKCRILNLEGRIEKGNEHFCIGMLEKENVAAEFAERNDSIIVSSDDGRLHDIVAALLEELRADKESGYRENSPMLDCLLGQFYLTLARQSKLTKNRAGQLEYVRKAQQFIDNCCDQEIGIADIAKAAGVSEGYLQRLYKAEKGITVMEEVIRQRVEKAKLLLKITTMPVIEIAVSVGFNSRQHFSATFKKETGCSPAEWRKKKGTEITTG